MTESSGHLGEPQVRDVLGWINAENRLPEGYGDYLVCYFGHNGRVVEQANYCGKWMLFRTDSSDDSITVNPTHWRTVPEPPEEAMTDSGESKAVPERWREVYDNYKSKEGVFESVERVQGRYWCHRAVEELGTAQATIREQAQTIERLNQRLRVAREDLLRYGQHERACAIYIETAIMCDCDCGFDVAHARADADRRAASQKGESQ